MHRRNFLKSNSLAALAMSSAPLFPDFLRACDMQNGKKSYAEYLRKSAVPKAELDVFLHKNTWAQFDPEVGYILGNYVPHDGIDNSYTLSTVMSDGKRSSTLYVDKPCRINTYGNSFTQCHQVSDGETWQEYLAAHFGEPIQNFGMGGFGVYQAYRRLIRREKIDKDSKYIILYMWGDDYMRSVFRCRYATYYTQWNDDGGYMFHGNFWSNLEMDLESGKIVEKENRIRVKEDVYKMSDPEFMYENLKDDLMVQLHLLSDNMVNADVATMELEKLAEILGLPEVDFSSPEKMMKTASALKNKYAFAATKYILQKTDAFCKAHGKELLLIHFDPYGVFKTLVRGEGRYDQEIMDFIQSNGYRFFDMNEVHLKDFQDFNLTLEAYMKRYFSGHYTPSGNHFFAYALKDILVEWLQPKPITYQEDDGKMIRFEGYLPKH